MTPGLKSFLQRWAITTLAVLVAAAIVPGINYNKPADLLVASLLLGILNAFLRPMMLLLALPLVIMTLGLFVLVINALVLYFVGYLTSPHFYVADFWSAFWGALIISIVSMAVNALAGTGQSRVRFNVHRRPPGATHNNHDDGHGPGGPVIDV